MPRLLYEFCLGRIHSSLRLTHLTAGSVEYQLILKSPLVISTWEQVAESMRCSMVRLTKIPPIFLHWAEMKGIIAHEDLEYIVHVLLIEG